MGQKLTVNVKDINGINSKTDFWVLDADGAATALSAFKLLTNAQIVSAYLTKDLPLSGLSDNNAVAANVETASEKAKIRLSGPATGGGSDRLTVTIAIPAPVGTIVNAITGAIDGALVTPFIGKVTTFTGLTTDTVDKVYYSKSR